MTTYEENTVNIENTNDQVEKTEPKTTTAIKVTEEHKAKIYKRRDERGETNTYGTVEEMLELLKDSEKYEAFNNVPVLDMAQGALKTLAKCFETLEFNKDRYVEAKLVEMTSKVNKSEIEKSNLEKELDFKNNEILNIQAELDHFKKLVEGKEIAIQEREDWLAKAQSENKSLRKEKDALEKELKEKDSSFSTILKEYDRYKDLSDSLQEQLNKEKEDRDNLINSATSMIKQGYKFKEDELNKEIKTLKGSVDTKDEEINKLTKEKTELKITVDAKDGIIAELKSTNKKDIEALKKSFKDDEDKLREQINKLISEKVKNETKISQVQELESTISEVKEQLQKSETKIKQLKDEHDTEINKLKDYHKQEINELKNKVKDINKEHIEEVETLKGKINKLNTEHSEEVKELKNKLKALNEEQNLANSDDTIVESSTEA